MLDSFTITFGGRPVIDPQSAMRTCRDHGFPDDHFRGLVSSYVCPTGSKPGTGHVLMRKKELDAIPDPADAALAIVYKDGAARKTVTLGGMIVTAATMAFPGRDDDPESAFLVSFADERHAKRRLPWSAGYNFRERNDTEYVSSTTNAGTAYTWQGIVNALWTAALGVSAPTLPYTPHGTPEGLDYYHCDSALDCLADLLLRIDCHLVHDPRTALYTIRRSASGRAALTAIDDLQRYYTWQDRGAKWPASDWPETIRVRFRKRPIPSNESSPYYTVNVTTTPAPSGIVAGTVLNLDDDLFALYPAPAGTLTNSATLSARADERMTEWVRRRSSVGFETMRGYKGLVPDLFAQLGETIQSLCISDRGDGLTTEIKNPQDRELDRWSWRNNPHWVTWAGETPTVTIQTTTDLRCDEATGDIIANVVEHVVELENRDGKIFLKQTSTSIDPDFVVVPTVCVEVLTADSSIACVDGDIVFTKVTTYVRGIDCGSCP